MKLNKILVTSFLLAVACGRHHKHDSNPVQDLPGQVVVEEPGTEVVFKEVSATGCDFGGTKTLLGKDKNKNGILDENDSDLTSVTKCNDVPFADNGADEPVVTVENPEIPGFHEIPGFPEIPTDNEEVAKKLTAIKLFTVTVSDPCGDAPDVQDDLVLTLDGGLTVLLRFGGKLGIELTFLTVGEYTDNTQCKFTVGADGSVDSL